MSLPRPYAHGLVLVVKQELRAPVVPAPPSGVIIEPFIPRDWRPLAPIATPAELRHFRARTDAGRVCLVAWRDQRPLGYVWLSPDTDPAMEGFRLPLPFGACYGWDLFVTPDARRSGVGAALFGALLLWAEADGYTSLWRVVAPHNVPALRTVARTTGPGASLVGLLRYVRLMQWFHARLEPAHGTIPDLGRAGAPEEVAA